jgi:hypothetical protein
MPMCALLMRMRDTNLTCSLPLNVATLRAWKWLIDLLATVVRLGICADRAHPNQRLKEKASLLAGLLCAI